MVRGSFSYSLGALALGVGACAAPGGDDALAFDAVEAVEPAAQRAPDADGGAGPVRVETAVRVSSASGVYLGGRRVLTNWHVCTDSMSLVVHNDPGGGAAPFREGAACNARRASCDPPAYVTFDGASRITAQAVFFSRLIDACIIELPAGASIPLPDAPVEIALTPVRLGQEVVVAGYPAGARSRVVEHCKVTKEIAPVRDPDKVNPSNLEVKSFELDCKTVQHGSSGSPVYDAATGNLLGLVWTGVCAASDGLKCRGPVYVTSASNWGPEHGARPATQRSRLDALLDDLGVP